MPDMFTQPIFIELLKAGLAAVVLLLGGNLSAHSWSTWQKRRDLQLSAADAFNEIYGEFFSTWKKWEFFLNNRDECLQQVHRWDLLSAACEVEGKFEAMLVRIVTQRRLSRDQVDQLGRFRQGFQTLRERIRAGKTLGWTSSENPEYRTFKELAGQIALLLASPLSKDAVADSNVNDAFARITSNQYEGQWIRPLSGPRKRQLEGTRPSA